jgi:hypothetical protein
MSNPEDVTMAPLLDLIAATVADRGLLSLNTVADSCRWP